MITVCVAINGMPIIARSAVNKGNAPRPKKTLAGEFCFYDMDDGRMLIHRREDGAIKLAIKMLEGVKDV